MQSHFVNQYHGGELGQWYLWYLGDQSSQQVVCLRGSGHLNDTKLIEDLMESRLHYKSLIMRSGLAWRMTLYV